MSARRAEPLDLFGSVGPEPVKATFYRRASGALVYVCEICSRAIGGLSEAGSYQLNLGDKLTCFSCDHAIERGE